MLLADAKSVHLILDLANCSLHSRTQLCLLNAIVTYKRSCDSMAWRSQASTHVALCCFPTSVIIYASGHIPVRTAKIHTSFRKDTLEHILASHRIQGNMLLFHGMTCNERFSTFHPDHKPELSLDVFASYPWEVDTW